MIIFNMFLFCYASDMSIVKSSLSKYNLQNVKIKSTEYNWTRSKTLTFLILQKLSDIEYNEAYKYSEIGNVEKFKMELNETLFKIKKAIDNIYNKNEWPTGKDRVSNKILDIESQITKYTENGEMRTLFRTLKYPESPKNDIEKAFKMLCTENMENVEYEIILGCNTGLLYETYGIKKHYNEVFDHKNLLFVAYNNLNEYLPELSILEIICHDWSKYLLDASIGYTYKWFHSRDKNSEIVKSWTDAAGQDFFDKTFDIAWRIHFTSEDHHPEYYKTVNSNEYYVNGIIRLTNKTDMNEIGLQESFIDMCGRELSNLMKSNSTGLQCAKYIEFDPKFLDRYNPADAVKIVNLILNILKDKASNEHYENKKKFYDEFTMSLKNSETDN